MINYLLLTIAGFFRRYHGHFKTWIWVQLQGYLKGGKITVQFPRGYKMIFDLTERWQRVMLACCYERTFYGILPHLLRSGDTVLDIGANIGYYTFEAASIVKPGTVHAFEPFPRIAAQLRESRALNPDLSVQVHETAVHERSGTGTFHLPPNDGWLSLEARFARPSADWQPCEVQMTSVDDFVKKNNIKKIEFSKFDIEGVEPQALRGAAQSIASGILESFSCEISVETRDEIFTYLKQFSFDAMIDLRDLEPVSQKTFKNTLTNILFLRGKCYQRWQQITSLQKAFVK